MAAATGISTVGAVRSRSDMQGVDEPGAFTAFDDNTAIFTGNGKISPQQITSIYLALLAKGDKEMAQFAASQDAAILGARSFIDQNRQLAGLTTQSPIPNGEQFNMDGTSLKDLLRPFANNLDALRAAVGEQGGLEGNSAMSRATGNVRTQGRTLPID